MEKIGLRSSFQCPRDDFSSAKSIDRSNGAEKKEFRVEQRRGHSSGLVNEEREVKIGMLEWGLYVSFVFKLSK